VGLGGGRLMQYCKIARLQASLQVPGLRVALLHCRHQWCRDHSWLTCIANCKTSAPQHSTVQQYSAVQHNQIVPKLPESGGARGGGCGHRRWCCCRCCWCRLHCQRQGPARLGPQALARGPAWGRPQAGALGQQRAARPRPLGPPLSGPLLHHPLPVLLWPLSRAGTA
jgi:hypothetical protein